LFFDQDLDDFTKSFRLGGTAFGASERIMRTRYAAAAEESLVRPELF